MSIPKRPPPTKLTDLDLYSSPHCEYKESIKNDHITCKGHQTQLMHERLLPFVRKNRIAVFNFCNYCTTELKTYSYKISNFVIEKKNKLKDQARQPDKFQIRRGVVASGTILSFIYGMRKGRYKNSLLRGFFYSSFTSLALGFLCFPIETDKRFQSIAYYGATAGLAMYNVYASDNKTLVNPLPCSDSLPKPPCNPQKENLK